MKSFLVSSAFCHCCSSTFHQTNVENTQNRSEDDLLISRIQSLHLLLEVDDHDEEEYTVVLTLGKRYANSLLAQYQSKFFFLMGTVVADEQAGVRLRGFALAFDLLAKASTFDFQRKIFELHFRGFLLVVVVFFVDA